MKTVGPIIVTRLSGARAVAWPSRRFAGNVARGAAEIAREAGARLLVLTHFSQRYPNEDDFLREAQGVFSDVIAARDLMTVPVPARV